MKVIVFDTETTGLPASYNSPLTDLSKWPHIVQLSFIVFDTLNKEVLEYTDHIIKLHRDILITPESVAIHKITMEKSQRDGISIKVALLEFTNACKDVDLIIGHNIQFDKNIITVEFQRNSMKNCLYKEGRPLNEFCTMKQTVELCKLPFVNKKNTNMSHYKWPTLTELHYHLFNAKPTGTHNAIADVMICLRCYVYLQHKYDIAFDEGVKIVFRTLFATHCLGGSAPPATQAYDPRNQMGNSAPPDAQAHDPPLGGSRGSVKKKSGDVLPSDARTSTLISLGVHIDTEALPPLPPPPPLPPMSPPPLRPRKSTRRIKVLPAPVPVQNIYDVPRFEIKTESFYSQYKGNFRN